VSAWVSASPDLGPLPATSLRVMETRAPSGLFPSGPPRPVFREPHPIRFGAVLTGAGATAAWLLLVGLLATTIRSYVWLTLAAAGLAWALAVVLLRFGDRGVATGVGVATSFGAAVAVGVVVVRWATVGWPLW
jgi:hypothetical protein